MSASYPVAEWQFGNYSISTNRRRLDIPLIHGFLTRAYWAEERSEEMVHASIEGSLPFGVYENGVYGSGKQVGFARVISDFAIFAHLADVFVLEAYQKGGLGRELVKTILSNEPLRTCSWTLSTKDAHGLYGRFGFARPEESGWLMRRKPVSQLPLSVL